MATYQGIIDSMTINENKTEAGSILNPDDFGTQKEAFNYLYDASKWANFRVDFLKYKTRQPFSEDGGVVNIASFQQYGLYKPITVEYFSKSNFSEAFGIELYARIMGVPEGIDKTKFGLVFKTENKKGFTGSIGSADTFQNRFSKKSPVLVYPNSPHLIDEQAGKPVSMNVKKFTGIALDGKIRNGADEPVMTKGLLPVLLSDLTEGTYERILEFDPTTRTGTEDQKSCAVETSLNKQLLTFRLHGKKVAQKNYNYRKHFFRSYGSKIVRFSHKIPFKIQLAAKVDNRHNDIILKDLYFGYFHFRGTAIFTGTPDPVNGAIFYLAYLNPNYSIDIIQ